MSPAPDTILLTGATGYIGGRLAPRLLERGHRIRCLTRSRAKLLARPWAERDGVEIVEGDAGDPAVLDRAMRGCRAAYFLVHSMEAVGEGYRTRDRALAEAFGRSAAAAGVERIIYLGGLGETGADLSEHLSSRREVESALRAGGVPVTVLRAAMIIGSGSASFEILRYLVERLPVMITPRWVRTESQPIAVRDVLHYLVASLETPATAGCTIDIGGPEIRSYLDLMREMAEALGLPRRRIVPVPVLTPRLSSLWIHLVTPLSSRMARPLAEGLRNRVVCRNDDAQRLMPHRCLGIREAMDLAIARVTSDLVETKWSDAGVMPGDPDWAGGTTFVDRRAIAVSAGLDDAWAAVSALGGTRGYYASNWLWRVRGAMDRLVGGPGLRRGRRSARELRLGDALDFWRVTDLDRPRRLLLAAEMRLPGVATLAFELAPADDDGARADAITDAGNGARAGPTGGAGTGATTGARAAAPAPAAAPRTQIAMTARFHPRGLAGIAYWYAVLPLHGIVFSGMLHGIAREAEGRATAARAAPSDS